MPAIEEMDVGTGMGIFMLATVGKGSDLESTYWLLRKYPAAIMLMGNRKECGSFVDGGKRKDDVHSIRDLSAKKVEISC